MSAPMLLGLLLGATASMYTYLHPSALGFGFPNINGEFAVRPTLGRLAGFLLGRWVGFLIAGIVLGGISQVCGPLGLRLGLACAALFSLFIFLFLATSSSPELGVAQKADLTRFSFPIVITGFLSTLLLHAPTLVAWLLALLYPGLTQGMFFFTNFFFGSTIFSLPLLLNMKWARSKNFKQLLRMLLLLCSAYFLLFSITKLLKA